MVKPKRQLNKRKVRVCLIILAVIFILIIGKIVGNNKSQYKYISVLCNNEIIKLDNEILEEDGIVFFSKDDVKKLFDDNIYYIQSEGVLISTGKEHVLYMKKDENTCLIDDVTKEIEKPLKEVNGMAYIPINEVSNVYGMEASYSKNTNRIILDSLDLEKKECKTIDKTRLKSGKIFFSSTLSKVLVGERLVVLDDSSNKLKVRNSDGLIGYVKAKKVDEIVTIRENKTSEEKKKIKVYSNYSNTSGVYEDFDVDTTLLNIVTPTFFHIDSDSGIIDVTNSNTATYSIYKAWCDGNLLKIMPSLTNNAPVSETLLNYDQRSKAINGLIDGLKKYQFKGVNINFESIDDINTFYRFIYELKPRCEKEGIVVIVTVNKNNNISRDKISNIVDYIVEE